MKKITSKVTPSAIEQILIDLHWMARRYADGRQSYAVGLFNQHTRSLLKLGIKLNPTGDETVWAVDSQGRQFDGLTKAEAEPGTPEARGYWRHRE